VSFVGSPSPGFAPGHLGELTQIVPFEMVDGVLAETGRMQRRVRDLPSRVVVYLLLAVALFAECSYRQVWARLVAALDGLPVATPSVAGLATLRIAICDATISRPDVDPDGGSLTVALNTARDEVSKPPVSSPTPSSTSSE
jgi:hypothetical protein